MVAKLNNPNPAAKQLRYGTLLVFAALVAFFLISFPGNRSEADDGFHYAYLVSHKSWAELLQPRYLLFLPLAKLLHQLLPFVDVYWLMCAVSSLCSAGTLVICYRFLRNILNLEHAPALWGCAFLLFSYGYWRYSVEAEVYTISNLLCIASLYLVFKTDTPRKAVMAGVLAGFAVLVYKPNAMPLFFAFPFAYIIKRRWADFFVYPLAGAAVVLFGYFAAYNYVKPDGTFFQFLTDGASRSYGSPLVTVFVVLSNTVATGFLYGIDAVETFIRSRFPANVIVEEVFAANHNGVFNTVALGTLALLGIAMLALLIMALRRFSKVFLKKEQWILLLWIVVYTGVLLYLDPNSPEPWTMLMVPLILLVTAVLIAPLFATGARKLPWAVIALLFLHNLVGGYAVIARKKTDYMVQQSGWLQQNAKEGDLVLSLGSGSFLAYIEYKCPVVIVSPEQAFDRCLATAEKTIREGRKVYLTEDMVHQDAAVKFRGGAAAERVAAFVAKYQPYLHLVNPDDNTYGKIYALQYTGPLQ